MSTMLEKERPALVTEALGGKDVEQALAETIERLRPQLVDEPSEKTPSPRSLGSQDNVVVRLETEHQVFARM